MEKKLQRDTSNKMLGGVASGLAEYFDVEITWVRLAFVLTVFAGLAGIPIYVVLWIVVPPKRFNVFARPGADVDYRVYENQSYQGPQPAPAPPKFDEFYREKINKDEKRGKLIAGMILVSIGSIFLLRQLTVLPWWFTFHRLWPLAMIIPGVLFIFSARNRQHFYEPEAVPAPAADEPVVTPAPAAPEGPAAAEEHTTV